MNGFIRFLEAAAEVMAEALSPVVIDGVQISRIGTGRYFRWETCIRRPDLFEHWLLCHPDKSSQESMNKLWQMAADGRVSQESFRSWSRELQRRIDFELGHPDIIVLGNQYV